MADGARIRDYRSSDADEVNRLAVAAFDQFRDAFDDWPAMRAGLSRTSELSSGGEIIVADVNQPRIDELLAPDREALTRLIRKED